MLLAWGFCCPNGLLVTRHFKTEWPGRSFRKLKYWFMIHLLLQCSLLAFVIVAFMSVVVHLTGYSKLTKLPFSAHPALGFLTFFLTILGDPRHAKERAVEVLIDKEAPERQELQNGFCQIQALRVAKYFIYGIHLAVSFGIIFVLVVMVAGS
ncbi:hypothetical protein CLF_105104 [Clonorchis sinensis]|nr:hypothetical protein CLF_105104 [Clonorchis sinensis]